MRACNSWSTAVVTAATDLEQEGVTFQRDACRRLHPEIFSLFCNIVNANVYLPCAIQICVERDYGESDLDEFVGLPVLS